MTAPLRPCDGTATGQHWNSAMSGLVEGTRGRGRPRTDWLNNITTWTGLASLLRATWDRHWTALTHPCSQPSRSDDGELTWQKFSQFIHCWGLVRNYMCKIANRKFLFSLFVNCVADMQYCHLALLFHDCYFSKSICQNMWLYLSCYVHWAISPTIMTMQLRSYKSSCKVVLVGIPSQMWDKIEFQMQPVLRGTDLLK